MFSRNSASSRAIPFSKMLERVKEDPFIPEQFPVNTKGMQPQAYITEGPLFSYAKDAWKMALEDAIKSAIRLQKSISNIVLNKEDLTIHKQLVNRLLEPFMWHTVIVTATEFDNFFKLRCDENAQYEIRRIADLMYEAYHAFDNNMHENSRLALTGTVNNTRWLAIKPQKLKVGEWHCPLVSEEDNEQILSHCKSNTMILINNQWIDCKEENHSFWKKKISVARCARVSYLTHDGKRDIEKDLELFERLRTSGHWSPFEHVATPYFGTKEKPIFQGMYMIEGNVKSGNFIGWKQFRKEFQDENCSNFRKES